METSTIRTTAPDRNARMCRRTAVAFWVVTGMLLTVVGAIVVLAIVNRPGMRPGAYSMTVGAGTAQPVTVQGGSRTRPAKAPTPLPAGWEFVAAVGILTSKGWLTATGAPTVQSSATPATVYLYRGPGTAGGSPAYRIWMNGAGWLGAASALTADASAAAEVRLAPSS